MANKDTKSSNTTLTLPDLNAAEPRWCSGCGDFSIILAEKKFLVDKQIAPAQTVNISGIGCSGRAPHYFNTYGFNTIHGRPIPIATGLALTRPDLKIFIHAGDGDTLSIGGNHLIHGINKNVNCVLLLYDNELYALTKSQTSPTTRKGHKTGTQPQGTYLDPLNPLKMALGLGASFIASTADWMVDHLKNTIEAAYNHPGFSFVHIMQRCPHYDPEAFDFKSASWFTFLTHKDGIEADRRLVVKSDTIEHDPTNLEAAFKFAISDRRYYGLFYQDKNKPRYDLILQDQIKSAKSESNSKILDRYQI